MRIWILEMFFVCLIGAVLGVLAGLGYANLMLIGLRTWWVDAIRTPFLFLHVSWTSIAIGAVAGVGNLPVDDLVVGQSFETAVGSQPVGRRNRVEAENPGTQLASYLLDQFGLGGARPRVGNRGDSAGWRGTGGCVHERRVLRSRRVVALGLAAVAGAFIIDGGIGAFVTSACFDQCETKSFAKRVVDRPGCGRQFSGGGHQFVPAVAQR